MKKSWDSKWEKFFRESCGNQYPEAAIIRFIARNYYVAKKRSHIKILDLGCGTGAVQWYLAREGFDAYGIDASPSAISKTRKRLRKEGLKSDLRVGDFVSLPYGNESIDTVIDAASIQHNSTDAIVKIIKEIHRVLKKGGKFFGMLIAESDGLSCDTFKTHFFQKKEIHDLFNKFIEIKIDHLAYTEENEKKFIKFWLVTSQKL